MASALSTYGQSPVMVADRYPLGEPSNVGQFSGFTYIGLLILIAVLGIGLSVTGVVFHQQAQRAKEKELLFAGDQIRHAIARYYESSPVGSKRFPETLDDLLLDRRYPATRRYLRRVFRDPMIGTNAWELVRAPDGGIIGVHSGSTARPIKNDNFPVGYEDFKDRPGYREWKFVYTVPAEEPAPPATGLPPATAPPGAASVK
ncbi:MAG: type II secretion system protein [Prolixibacteraceae bacterium]|nr:type II secretion system protein [Burkholderiales bacterium]